MKKLVKLWLINLNNKDKIYYDLTGFIKDINIWINAYMKIAKNKGGLTPGPDNETLDGMTLKQLENLKELICKGKYQWKGSKRILIPKPGKIDKRPLSIPATSDKIVQEVLRSILEPIFEFSFSDKSHGFRRGRSCHTALSMIDRDFKSAKWFIEGDLKKYFDTINHKILMSKIKIKIKDKNILKLIESGLKIKIFSPEGPKKVTKLNLGLPQGGILSP